MKKSVRCCAIVLVLLSQSFAADWPRFRGPAGDGKSLETGLLQKWPAAGPRLVWSVEGVGDGWSSVSVVNGWVYTTGLIGKEKTGFVFAVSPEGKIAWQQPYGPGWKGAHPGTHSTPTVDGDRLYVMSGYGLIACYNRTTGKGIWKIDCKEVFGAAVLKWGIAESVLIYDDKVICTPGGTKATMVALDKMTGKTIWTNLVLTIKKVNGKEEKVGQKSAYCTPSLIKANGKELIMQSVQKSIILVEPETGKVICDIPHEKRHDLAAAAPVYYNNSIYVTTGYERDDFPDRGYMFQLSADLTSGKLKWTDRNLDCHHGGVVLLDGCVHGTTSAIYAPASNERPKGNWICLDLNSGKVKYKAKLMGKGSAIYADGKLYCYGETGVMALVKATATGYEMVSSFEITRGDKEHWAHPAISNGILYIRHGKAVMAYDIRRQ